MVEAHLAKLVDDDRSVRERRIFQKSIEKRCLSGAEKPVNTVSGIGVGGVFRSADGAASLIASSR
jgi:predicted NUDIX family phosphoesterase